jgi:hypothetical protein
MEFGRIIFRKNVNWGIFFGKKHEKLAHLQNLAPKIIYGGICVVGCWNLLLYGPFDA